MIDDTIDYILNEYKLNYNYEYIKIHHHQVVFVWLQHQKQIIYFHQLVLEFPGLVYNINDYLTVMNVLIVDDINFIDKVFFENQK